MRLSPRECRRVDAAADSVVEVRLQIAGYHLGSRVHVRLSSFALTKPLCSCLAFFYLGGYNDGGYGGGGGELIGSSC